MIDNVQLQLFLFFILLIDFRMNSLNVKRGGKSPSE